MSFVPASTNLSSKFDPAEFNEPDMSWKNGKPSPTNYQAAQEIRNFMKEHEDLLPDGKLAYSDIWEGTGGNVAIGGKLIPLSERQKAAFQRFAADDFALFNRFDGGRNNTKDNNITISDIEAGIKDARILHGAEYSKEGHWKDPAGTTTGAQAKEALSKYFTGQFGADWKEISLTTFGQIANNGRYYNESQKNWVEVTDPNVIQAATWVVRNSGEIDKGGMNSLGMITRAEFDAWNKV